MALKDFNFETSREGVMNPVDRLERMMVLINLLKYSRRRSYDQLAAVLGKSSRQIRRDINMLERFFEIDIDEQNRPFIISEKDTDHIPVKLSEEEIVLIIQLLRDSKHRLAPGLLKKLNFNLEVDMGLYPDLAETINLCRTAINNKQRLLIKGYLSARSDKEKDVEVEPFHMVGLKYLQAFDVNDRINKMYSFERMMQSVVLLPRAFTFELEHKIVQPDVFGLNKGKVYQVKLLLTTRAYLLLKEEYPLSSTYLKAYKEPNTDPRYGWKFEAPVLGLEGVGRFVLGLIDEILILEGKELKAYLMEKLTIKL